MSQPVSKTSTFSNSDHLMSEDSIEESTYAVVLSGGSGTRFWPKSRHKTPKQLCRLGRSDVTMLELTLQRLDGFIPASRRIVITHQEQFDKTKALLKDQAFVIAEPDARNTASALGLAAKVILELERSNHALANRTPIMCSFHADHFIPSTEALLKSVKDAIKSAKSGQLTLIGITPRYPETGYGYIKRTSRASTQNASPVEAFVEKPSYERAKEYISSGNFLWNSGLFVFPVKEFLSEIEVHMPDLSIGLRAFEGSLPQLLNMKTASELDQMTSFVSAYKKLAKVSIDHGILEKSHRVFVVDGSFEWQDVGSWDALAEAFGSDEQGNYLSGPVLPIEVQNSTIESDGPLIAALGVKDLVIVHADGAILVCPKNRAQDVKLIVDRLRDIGRLDLL